MTENEREQVRVRRVEAVSFPLLFAALTGRSGHGLARMGRAGAPVGSASEAAASQSHDELVATMTGGMARSDLPAFAGSERLRPDGRPRPEFRAELRRIPDALNALTVVATLAAAVTVVWAVIAVDHWLATALAVPVMGIVMLRMFILHHEAAHRLLFSNRLVNDIVGVNFLGWLTFGTGTHHYRRGHANHHRDEFGPKEPDFLLYALYPVSRDSMRRKLVRDLFGVSGYRIVKPRFTGLVRPPFLVLSLRFFAGQALVLAAFWAIGHPWLYLVLWVLPYFTYYQVANRLRVIAEHGGMTRTPDRRNTTHHVRQSTAARLFLVPYNVGYHLAHHVDSGVPARNLPRLQRALEEDGYLPPDAIWPSYRSLWQALVRSPA